MNFFRKREREFKVPERDKDFKIYQFIKIEGLRSNKKRKFEPTSFVSPIFGTTVKDVTVAPYVNKDTGDKVRQLDFLRENPIIDPKEYHEFKDYMVNAETRKEIFGEDVYIDRDRKYVNPFEEREKIHVPFTGRDEEQTFEELLYEKPVEDSFFKAVEPEFESAFKEETPVFEQKPYEDDIQQFDFEDETEETPVFDDYIEPVEEIQNDFVGIHRFEEKFDNEVFEPEIYEEEEIVEEQVFEEPVREPQVPRPLPVKKERKPYELPPISMFSKVDRDQNATPQWLLDQKDKINKTLLQFNVPGEVENTIKGPTVTRHEIKLESGINVNRVTNIKDNLMMDLAASTLRIEAPIPGKAFVGLEVPNTEAEIVAFGNVIDDPKFLDPNKPLRVALGMDIDGTNIYEDIDKMPHGLVAGATNSGKSVCINTIIMSLLLKNHPDDLKFILIDPKMVELSIYNEIPHLATPVITDPKLASTVLNWAVEEMERRFRRLSESYTRNIEAHNEKAEKENIEKMPYIIIIIDELADLMMSSPADVESSIQRLTQKARAAGIYLIVATQRPTTDVVKGTIKANIPTRIAFKVSSFTDSVVILDVQGAEQLLGRGDMLLKKEGRPLRLQGAYIKDDEIFAVTDFIRSQMEPDYLINFEQLEAKEVVLAAREVDELLIPVAEFVVESQSASLNSIQRHFGIGFNRAQDMFIALEELNIIGPQEGRKAREVLFTKADLEELKRNV